MFDIEHKGSPGGWKDKLGKNPQSQHVNLGVRFGGVEKLNQGTELMPCRRITQMVWFVRWFPELLDGKSLLAFRLQHCGMTFPNFKLAGSGRQSILNRSQKQLTLTGKDELDFIKFKNCS